jgi:chemotaxis protein MotB
LNLSQSILFASGSARLNPQGVQVLQKVVRRLVKLPNFIEVQGHTDNIAFRGSKTNWELAAERSAQVVRLFIDNGVEPGRMSLVSYGEFAPIASNDSPAGRARNRRIEIRLKPAGTPSPDAPATSTGTPHPGIEAAGNS